MADATEYILQELARRLDEVTSRLEGGLNRLDGTYVRKDVWTEAQGTIAAERTRQSDKIAVLETRVDELENDKQWLVRLVIGFIIVGILGAVITFTHATGSG